MKCAAVNLKRSTLTKTWNCALAAGDADGSAGSCDNDDFRLGGVTWAAANERTQRERNDMPSTSAAHSSGQPECDAITKRP